MPRQCELCGLEQPALFPLRISTAMRWACEWCLRDALQEDRDRSPGDRDPDGEAHRGTEAASYDADQHEQERRLK